MLSTAILFSDYPAEPEQDPSPLKHKKEKLAESPLAGSTVLCSSKFYCAISLQADESFSSKSKSKAHKISIQQAIFNSEKPCAEFWKDLEVRRML